MGHQHLPNSSSHIFGTDQYPYQSHVTAQRSQIHMGRAAAPGNGAMFYPIEHAPMSQAFCASQRGLEWPVAHSVSSVRSESPLQGAVLGPAFHPFPRFPAVGSFYQAPENNNLGHVHTSYYDRHPIHEVAGLVDPITGTRRRLYKRKSPSISVASERDSIRTFDVAGSSSSSSELQLEKSTSDYRTSEDSRRNVRSRYRLDLEPTLRGTCLSNYSHHYSPTTHLTNQSGAVDVANFSAVRITQEQIFPAAHENIGMNQEMNQFPIGGGSTAENGGHFHDSIPRRNFVLPPYPQNVHAHAAWDMNSSYSRRGMTPHQAGLSFSRLGHETVPLENSLLVPSENSSYRYPRPPSSRGWRNGYRNGRSRIAIERSESLSNPVYTRDRLGSEAFTMVDHLSLYGSRNSFDQLTDMRIDVDNMSYEELLALEERIGNVSTGLSEDMITKCLETTCSSSDHDLEERCAICLEEYKSKEEVQTVKNCGHEYHVGCIKKWLLMKNACPICKAPALSDSLKEQ